MSRLAMPKSRSDKSRAAFVPVPTPVAALVELVPGRFTENDWQAMVVTEDGENSVMNIIEDIISQTLDQCFRIYIENQLLPFTITQAKDALLQIIEWQFLIHDPGESNISLTPSWQEDTEPQANVTDSWAQGSVPVLRLPDTAALQGKESTQEPPDVDLQPKAASADHSSTFGDHHDHGAQGSLHSSPLTGFYPDLKQVTTEPEEAGMEPEQTPEAIMVRKSCGFKARRHLHNAQKVWNISKPLFEREADLVQPPASEEMPLVPCEARWVPPYLQNAMKIQRGRLPSNNIVTFDELGNVTSVKRLDPTQFRRRWVKPFFRLVEPDPNPGSCRPPGSRPLRPLVFHSGQFRYNNRRAQQLRAGKGNGPGTIGTGSTAGPGVILRPKLPDTCAASTTPDVPEFIPDGAKDRNRSKCGWYPEYEEKSLIQLKPICNRLFIPPISVEQLSSSILL
ncbi:uncharacterized protein C2orf81 homolog [Hemitrygon akajei]|uniref:uncharacterized protein C2orf81 homolog n=1 Tax=Hemitrygon akajei TaxID=2704970 RepID=UPI003BF9B162